MSQKAMYNRKKFLIRIVLINICMPFLSYFFKDV